MSMRKIWMTAFLALVLTGCKSVADIRPDTIVDIPVYPTEARMEAVTELTTEATEPPTELPTETEPATQMTEPTEPATQPPKNNTGSASKPSSGKKPSQGSGNKKPAATKNCRKVFCFAVRPKLRFLTTLI